MKYDERKQIQVLIFDLQELNGGGQKLKFQWVNTREGFQNHSFLNP